MIPSQSLHSHSLLPKRNTGYCGPFCTFSQLPFWSQATHRYCIEQIFFLFPLEQLETINIWKLEKKISCEAPRTKFHSTNCRRIPLEQLWTINTWKLEKKTSCKAPRTEFHSKNCRRILLANSNSQWKSFYNYAGPQKFWFGNSGLVF